MKKYFIIAAVALAASAACTKTNTDAPETPISFNVVKYAAQTKANTALNNELVGGVAITSFYTNAWYHTTVSGSASVQAFMADEQISYDSSVPAWAPTSRVYYWPKTGYINFFSYAGSPVPTAKAENSLTYTDVTIATDSNILVADAAYGFSANNNPATYTAVSGVAEGVPTLFRHMLAQVKFDVKVDATDITDNKYKWEATINSVAVKYRNQGTLAVAFDEETTKQTKQFTTATWTPKDVANVELNKVSSAVVVEAVGGAATNPAAELVAQSVVMPQVLNTTGVTFEMNYTLKCFYNNDQQTVEDVPVSAIALTTFAPSITSWEKNTIYTYHIIIKPNGTILFDPAVEAWENEAQEPAKEF